MEIVFDPSRITFERLLDIFWRSHDPWAPSYSRQYRAVVFHHTETQRRAFLRKQVQEEARRGQPIHTALEPVGVFYPAEDYHQKHNLRRFPQLLREMERYYPTTKDLVRSTAAARLNGYAGGFGSPGRLEKDLPLLGLSAEGADVIRSLVARQDER